MPETLKHTVMSSVSSISVVIPVWNGERFLAETMTSVFRQTHIPDEIVVVDDYSTDESVRLVREVAEQAPCAVRIVELPENSGGPARPMNVGIEAAKGEWISLLDQDDLMHPEKLEAQGNVLAKHAEVDLVLSDYESCRDEETLAESNARHWFPQAYGLMRSTTEPLEIVEPVRLLTSLVTECGLALSCSNYVFRKTLWERVGGFDPAAEQTSDYDFLLRAIDRPVAWLNRVLFRKRVHDTNLWRSSLTNYLHLLSSQQACFARFPHEPQLKDAVVRSTRATAQFLRWGQWYWQGTRVAMQLARLGKPRAAAVEASKTVLACLRDITLGRVRCDGRCSGH